METFDFSWILKVPMKVSENEQIWDSRLIGSISTDTNLHLKSIQLSV